VHDAHEQEQRTRHMTKLFLSTLAVTSLSATDALANGNHSGDAFRVLIHMLSEPDHLAMLSVVVIAAFVAIRKLRSRA
jgi:hypothetical protein